MFVNKYFANLQTLRVNKSRTFRINNVKFSEYYINLNTTTRRFSNLHKCIPFNLPLKKVTSKHFNVSSTLLLGWFDVAMSNQRWNNVVYVNVEIYNVEQRWNTAVFFNVELNNVRQRRNNVAIFNVDFHNVG